MPSWNNDPNVHYVKFIRGSIAAWENLNQTPNKIDDDTLYFIYSSAQNTTEGKLYLGKKLISGVGEGAGEVNINNIGGIVIDNETLADKQILVYNETSDQWENTSLSTIIDTAIGDFVGATSVANGSSGLVPEPKIADRNKFLKGDGTWTSINLPTFDNNVFVTNATGKLTLAGFEAAQVGSLPIKTAAGLEWTDVVNGALKRKITTLEKLQAQVSGDDPEPLDPNTIYMVPSGSSTQSNRYDEYMIIDGALELLGTFGSVNLADYVQKTVYNAEVKKLEDTLYDRVDSSTGDLIPGLVTRVEIIEENYITKSQIGDLSTLILSGNNTTLVEEVNTINSNVNELNERLKWQELLND